MGAGFAAIVFGILFFFPVHNPVVFTDIQVTHVRVFLFCKFKCEYEFCTDTYSTYNIDILTMCLNNFLGY